MHFSYRAALTSRRADDTEAEVGIEFNNTASQDQIPQADVVAQTLVEAVSNPNNTFNLTIDTNSVKVVGK